MGVDVRDAAVVALAGPWDSFECYSLHQNVGGPPPTPRAGCRALPSVAHEDLRRGTE